MLATIGSSIAPTNIDTGLSNLFSGLSMNDPKILGATFNQSAPISIISDLTGLADMVVRIVF